MPDVHAALVRSLASGFLSEDLTAALRERGRRPGTEAVERHGWSLLTDVTLFNPDATTEQIGGFVTAARDWMASRHMEALVQLRTRLLMLGLNINGPGVPGEDLPRAIVEMARLLEDGDA